MKTGHYWFKKCSDWHVGYYNEEYPDHIFYNLTIFKMPWIKNCSKNNRIDEIDDRPIIRKGYYRKLLIEKKNK